MHHHVGGLGVVSTGLTLVAPCWQSCGPVWSEIAWLTVRMRSLAGSCLAQIEIKPAPFVDCAPSMSTAAAAAAATEHTEH